MPEQFESQKNVEFTLLIHDLARGGSGVGRDASGRITFVPFSAPGDRLRVRVTRIEKNFAHAEIIETLEKSPHRVEPRCPAFGVCGGCQWQHIPYDVQWKTKLEGVSKALARAKISYTEQIDQLPADQVWEYRNRVQLRGEGEALGFFQGATRTIVAVDRCDIARPEINQVWREIREEGQRLESPYKVEVEVMPDGQLRKTWNSRHGASGFRQVHDLQNVKLQNWVRSVLPESDILYDIFGGSGNLSFPMIDRSREIHCVDLTSPQTPPPGTPPHLQFHSSSAVEWLKTHKSKRHNQSLSAAILDPPREGLGKDFASIASSLDRLDVTAIAAVGCDLDSWIRDISKWAQFWLEN